MKIRREEGDKFGRNVYHEREYRTEIFEVVEWQKMGDAWFPKECVETLDKFYHKNGYRSETQVEFKTVAFDPDHEALGSFLPTDIQDGASVHIYAFPRTKFIWKDGKAVDGEGREVKVIDK